jgi:hypothetical protein
MDGESSMSVELISAIFAGLTGLLATIAACAPTQLGAVRAGPPTTDR